jgi:Spy/CpxP family protein refolding chaperone
MSMGKWFLCAAIALTSASVFVSADDTKAPATQPADTKTVHTRKLTEPWNLLKTLTPEQTAQIEKIHADAVEQTDKIKAKEKDDINALLTPDQVTELKAAEAKHALEVKERNAHKKMATTEPAK